ncbi:hypothetical protein FRC10_011435 [Ceratobasidium sp. 414]|nr:hypothetical protein FRC10_011435 [Ceratobasidium sp. 414]
MAPVQSKPAAEPGPSMCKTKAKDKALCELTPEPLEDDTPAPATGKGCRAGVKNLMTKDKLDFVKLVEELLLISPAVWDQVYKMYNKKHQPHAVKTLKGIWPSLTTGPALTGNPEMEEVIALALEVDMVLNVATETKQLDDNAVPPPVINEDEQEGESEDENDGDDQDKDGEDQDKDDALDWVPTKDDTAGPTEPGVSKKSAILVAGMPSLQEGDVKPKPRPKPKAHPQPLDQRPPATATTVATPTHTAAVRAKAPFVLNSGSSVKPKVKAEPGLATKAKGKGKLTPAFTDSILEIDATAVRTAAARTRQNADTLVTRMLDTFDPAYTKQAAKLQQSHVHENMVVFNQQQRIQNLELQLAEANQRAGDEHEKYFNTWLELNQAQMQVAMYSHLGFGGAGATTAGVPGFGLAPATFGGAGGLPRVYAPIPQFQANNPGIGAHPGMPNALYNVPQPGFQQHGEGFGAYNPMVQPGVFPAALYNPGAPVAPAAPVTPVTPAAPAPAINVQAPTPVDTPDI